MAGLCNKVLGIGKGSLGLEEAGWIGQNSEKRIIWEMFRANNQIKLILKNANKFKGPSITIDKDLGVKTRWKRGNLYSEERNY